jgi:hypothetical protein
MWKVAELGPPIARRSPFTSAELRIVGTSSFTLSSASPLMEMFGGSACHINLTTKTQKKNFAER